MHRNYGVIGGVELGIWGDMYSVLRGKGVSGGRGNPARMPKGASERAAARFNTTICRKHRKQRSGGKTEYPRGSTVCSREQFVTNRETDSG